jgi:hypothetical protein
VRALPLVAPRCLLTCMALAGVLIGAAGAASADPGREEARRDAADHAAGRDGQRARPTHRHLRGRPARAGAETGLRVRGAPWGLPRSHSVAEPPGVQFVGLRPGQRVRSRHRFRVRLTGFSISPTLTPRHLVPGQGFLHFSMDGGAFDLPAYSGWNGYWAVRAGTQGRYSPAASTTITYSGLPRGRHTLVVSLADNFHAEIGVQAAITVVVR